MADIIFESFLEVGTWTVSGRAAITNSTRRRECPFFMSLLISLLVSVLCLGALSSIADATATPKSFQTCLVRHSGNALISGDEVKIAKYDVAILNRFHYDNIAGNT
jgi:hypothetical protein